MNKCQCGGKITTLDTPHKSLRYCESCLRLWIDIGEKPTILVPKNHIKVQNETQDVCVECGQPANLVKNTLRFRCSWELCGWEWRSMRHQYESEEERDLIRSRATIVKLIGKSEDESDHVAWMKELIEIKKKMEWLQTPRFYTKEEEVKKVK